MKREALHKLCIEHQMSTFFSEYVTDVTYDETLEALDGETLCSDIDPQDAVIWCWFDDMTVAELIENIESAASHLENLLIKNNVVTVED